MSSKVKTITLHFPHLNPDPMLDIKAADAEKLVYRVAKVTDSIDYSPGQHLLRKEVENLCAARDWKVTILPAV